MSEWNVHQLANLHTGLGLAPGAGTKDFVQVEGDGLQFNFGFNLLARGWGRILMRVLEANLYLACFLWSP